MAWIESHSTLRTHKKLRPLFEALGVNRNEAIGLLHCLWWWAIDNREDGDLAGLLPRDIAMACDWTGDHKKLVKALKSTGWITKDDRLKDWMDYAGRLVTDRLRKRAERTARRTSPDLVSDSPRTVLDKSYATVPDRTVPDSKSGLLFQRPQELVIKRLFSERLHHEVDSEVNQMEYDRLVKMIQSDPKIKDPMAVAIYRATHG